MKIGTAISIIVWLAIAVLAGLLVSGGQGLFFPAAAALSFMGALIGDAIRRFTRPTALLVKGRAYEILKAKLYWLVGPQLIGVIAGCFIAIGLFSPEPRSGRSITPRPENMSSESFEREPAVSAPAPMRPDPEDLHRGSPEGTQAAPSTEAAAYWYRCDDPEGFYPYIQSCRGPWKKVPAQADRLPE